MSIVAEKYAELSFEQEHLWTAEFVPTIPPTALFLEGDLDVESLTKAVNHVVHRHEVLRTLFRCKRGHPYQVILPEVRVRLTVQSLEGTDGDTQEQALKGILQNEAALGFDLEQAPLIRLGLVRLHQKLHVLHFTLHHIISDLWSFKVFLRDLAHYYSSYVQGDKPSLPSLSIQYADYAQWQREWWRGAVLDQQLSYWTRRLQNMAALELPTDIERPKVPRKEGSVVHLVIPRDIGQRLKDLSRDHGATLYMTLLAAFNFLLFECTRQDDIGISSLFANRGRVDTEAMIGVFANRVVLRNDLRGRPSFRDTLQRVRNICLEAHQFQHLSFWQMARRSSQIASVRNPGIIFTMQDAPVESASLYGLKVRPSPYKGNSLLEGTGLITTGRYDQEWQIWRDGAELTVVVSYRTDIFRQGTVRSMLQNFRAILTAVIVNPDTFLRDIESLCCTS